jgi:hypothetical protein
LWEPGERYGSVLGNADYFQSRIGRDDVAEDPPNDGRVVHNQDPQLSSVPHHIPPLVD